MSHARRDDILKLTAVVNSGNLDKSRRLAELVLDEHKGIRRWPSSLVKRSREEWLKLGATWTEKRSREVIVAALKELKVSAMRYARMEGPTRAALLASLQEILSEREIRGKPISTRLSRVSKSISIDADHDELRHRISRLHAAIEEYTWTPEDQRELNLKGYVTVTPSPEFHALNDDTAVERLRKTGKRLREGADENDLDNSYMVGIVVGWGQASNWLLEQALAKFTEGKLAEAEALRLMSEEAETKKAEARKTQLDHKARHAEPKE